MRGSRSQDYTPLPLSEKEPVSLQRSRRAGWSRRSILGLSLCMFGALSALYGLIRYAVIQCRLPLTNETNSVV
jgi:hypothetical protein